MRYPASLADVRLFSRSMDLEDFWNVDCEVSLSFRWQYITIVSYRTQTFKGRFALITTIRSYFSIRHVCYKR